MFLFKPVEDGDDVDQNAFPNLNFWAGGFVGEDGRGGFVYLASSTCQNFWLVSYDYDSYNGNKSSMYASLFATRINYLFISWDEIERM